MNRKAFLSALAAICAAPFIRKKDLKNDNVPRTQPQDTERMVYVTVDNEVIGCIDLSKIPPMEKTSHGNKEITFEGLYHWES